MWGRGSGQGQLEAGAATRSRLAGLREVQRAVSTAAAARREGRGDKWGQGLREGLGAVPRGTQGDAWNRTMDRQGRTKAEASPGGVREPGGGLEGESQK